MEEICNYYQQISIQDTETIRNATQQLLLIYQNPSNIFLIIQIINEVDNSNIIKLASISLLKMMKTHWCTKFLGTQDGESIKQQLLFAFQKYQYDVQISNLIADCLQPILQSQSWTWTDLVNFIDQSISESTLKVVLYLLEYDIKTPEKINQEIINFCISMIQKSISTNNAQIIICSSRIFALLSSFLPQEYSEVLSNFMNVYVALFSENPDTELAKSINKSFNIKNTFFDVNQLLLHLLELSKKSNPRIYFITIRKLVSTFGKDLRGNFPYLLQTTIDVIGSLFTNECYDESGDSHFISGIVQKCLKKCSFEDFSNLILHILSTPAKNIQELYAILEITYNIIDGLVKISSSSLYNTILDLILKSFAVDNHTIIEISLLCLINLINAKIEFFEYNCEDVFKTIFPLIEKKHDLIIIYTLKALSLIIFDYNISSNILIPVVPSFVQAVEQNSGYIKAEMILVICSLAHQLQEKIEPFVPSILPLIINCTNDPDEEVQSRVIEALSSFILYAPQQCDSIIEQSMRLFVESLGRDDLVYSAFFALKNAAMSSAGIDPFIDLAVLNACRIAAPDTEDFSGNTFSNIESAIEFLNTAYKFRPAACEKWKLAIIGCCLVNMSPDFDEDLFDAMDNDVLSDASITIMRALNGSQIPPEILTAFISNVESNNKYAARATFKSASYLLKHQSEMDENANEFIIKILNLAIKGLKRELPCQTSEKKDQQILANYDNILFDSILKFLSRFAQKRPNTFPSSALLNLIISLKGKVSKYETEVCLSPFSSLKSNQQPNEIDPQLFEFTFLVASENCITKWPFTILREILTSNESILSNAQQLFELCSSRINDSLSALSLLFTLASKRAFPVDQVIGNMIDCINIKGDIENLSVIWNCMFSLIQGIPGIEQPFLESLITKTAETIDRYRDDFPENSTQTIIQFYRSVLPEHQALTEKLAPYPYVCNLIQNQ